MLVIYTSGDGLFYRCGDGWFEGDLVCPVDAYYIIGFRRIDTGGVLITEIESALSIYSGDAIIRFGAAIKEINNVIDGLCKDFSWTNAYINGYGCYFSGDASVSPYRLSTRMFIQTKGLVLRINPQTGYKVAVYRYSASKESFAYVSGSFDVTSDTTISTWTAAYVRLSIIPYETGTEVNPDTPDLYAVIEKIDKTNEKFEKIEDNIDSIQHGIQEEVFDVSKMRVGYGVTTTSTTTGRIIENSRFAISDYIPISSGVDSIKYSGIIADNAVRILFLYNKSDSETGIWVLNQTPLDGELMLTNEMKTYNYVVFDVYRGDSEGLDVSNVSIKLMQTKCIDDLYSRNSILSARVDTLEAEQGGTEIRLPAFCLMFDAVVYDATYLTLLDDLNTLGVKATFAVVPSMLTDANANTFLTRVKNEGHEIAIHSDGSVIDLEATTTKTASEIYTYLVGCINSFVNALGVRPRGLVIAGGHGTNDLVWGEARKLFDYCQGVANYANRSTEDRLPYNTKWFDTIKMMRTNAEPQNVQPNTVVQEIERCYDAKGFMVLYGHNYISGGSYQMTTEMLTAICNKLNTYGNKVVFTTCYDSITNFCAVRHNDIVSLMPELEGKIINYLGDSYIANNATAGNDFYDTWAYKLSQKYHCVCRNYGIGGNPMTVERSGVQPMNVRYADMDNDADYVVVVGGKNDYNVQVPINDFKAGVRTLCEGLVAKYVNRKTKICFFTPWRVPQATIVECDPSQSSAQIPLLSYVDAIVEVCKEYSIPVFDTKNSDIYMFNATFRHNYC